MVVYVRFVPKRKQFSTARSVLTFTVKAVIILLIQQ